LRLRRAGVCGEYFFTKKASLFQKTFSGNLQKLTGSCFPNFPRRFSYRSSIKSKTLFRTDTSVSQCALLIRGIALALSTKNGSMDDRKNYKAGKSWS